MANGVQQFKIAVRALTRTPGTSSVVVVTLALAIAAATIIASTIDMVWRFIPAVAGSVAAERQEEDQDGLEVGALGAAPVVALISRLPFDLGD